MFTKKQRILRIVSLTMVALGVSSSQQFEAGNRIDLRVSVNVEIRDSVFLYKYVLTNGDTAKQEVYQFDIISGVTSVLFGTQCPVDWRAVVFKEKGLKIRWIARAGASGFKAAIKPSSWLKGFGFSTRSLPSVVTYYAEGNHPLPRFDEGMAPDSIPGYDDLTPYGPGVVGKTIGPVLPPDPFEPVGFLDTLSSYAQQSLAPGWIHQQSVADKYIGHFSSAKTSLLSNNLNAARMTLQQVLRDVDLDSTANITSEAYALLRFNTEFLLGKLPAVLAITILNPAMTLAGSGAFRLTVSGSNFINGSTVNWKGSARTTTFVADSILRASILASDVAVADSPPVTVKNPDGSESNALRFYVLSAIAWIDTLVSYKHRAVELGWLKVRRDDDCDDDEKPDDGIVKNLDKRLEKARKELVKGDSVQARKELEKFVKKVEQLRKRSEEAETKNKPDQVIITKEAYLLLKNNAVYLIERLPEKKGKGKK